MQISLTVENKTGNHNKDTYDNASPNVDSLSAKLKHNVLKESGKNFISPTNFALD